MGENLQKDSQGGLGELLLSEVQRVVECGDAVGMAGGAWWQARTEECIAGSVDEGHHGVPALVVEPDLRWGQGRGVRVTKSALPPLATCPLPPVPTLRLSWASGP